VGDNAKQFTTEYGNISAASIGAIQRGLVSLDQQGADRFFGEPMLNFDDLMQTDAQGRGIVNILAADRLLNAPRLYAAFLLWLLSDLFEKLPEVGDRDKPKLVFFFDEAHLLFAEAPRPLLEKVEQVVRLVRSKGVGVYFVTQNPLDIPDSVLGQLGNRVQHALRAFTPRDQKAVKAAAQTMRANPAFNVETAISELGVGEALVSMLDEKGRPTIVERGFVVSPGSRIGPIDASERKVLISTSVVAGVYDTTEDRESAYELLTARSASTAPSAGRAGTGASSGRGGTAPTASTDPTVSVPSESNWTESLRGSLNELSKSTGRKDSIVEAMAKSAARSIGTTAGRELLRGVLGTLLGGGSRKR
jgi:DNA helicase HerA-like ATPase